MESCPTIVCGDVAEDERLQVRLLNHALYGMQSWADDFGSALKLFDWCQAQTTATSNVPDVMLLASWVRLASRDSVMSIYHFRNSMLSANGFAKTCKLISGYIEHDTLGAAHAKFQQEFPDYAKTRHAAAHAGEMFGSVDRFKKNSFSGALEGPFLSISGQGAIIQDIVLGRLFTTTGFEGKIVRCEISKETLAKLREVNQLFFSAFRKIPCRVERPALEG